MLSLFILILVSTVIMYNTDVVKQFIGWAKETVACVAEKRFSEIKFGVPVALGFSVWAALTVGVSIFTAIFDATGIQYEITQSFEAFSIASTALILSQGSGAIISLIEKYKEGQEAIKKVLEQELKE